MISQDASFIMVALLYFMHFISSIVPFCGMLFIVLTLPQNIYFYRIKIKRIYFEIIIWLISIIFSLLLLDISFTRFFLGFFSDSNTQRYVNSLNINLRYYYHTMNFITAIAAGFIIRKKISDFLASIKSVDRN